MALRLDNTKPAFILMISITIFALMITVALSRLDATNHYYYVGQIQSECFQANQYNPQGNTNPICIDQYKKLGLPIGDQKDIPNKYNESLNENLYIIAGAFGGMWITISLVLDSIRKTKPDPIVIYFTIVIVLTILLPDFTAMGDYLYFYWLHIPEPTTWQWLDSAGIFPSILKYTHESDVSLKDMYIAIASGIGIIIAIWIPIIITFAQSKKQKIIDLI